MKDGRMARKRDIEEVLSAIRRLVATDPTLNPAADPETNAAADPAADPRTHPAARRRAPTLLLSPAQRVGGPADRSPEMPADRPAGDGAAHRTAADDVVADDGAADGDVADDGAADPAADPSAENVDEWTAGPGVTRRAEAANTETDSLDEPFDIWARATDDFELPHDYAEDADFEEAERRGSDAGAAHRPPSTTSRTSVPLSLSDLSTGLVDEDGLRDMIADVVRQELSGELGERITRNVRKLVRREIRQILASEDLD